MDVSTVIGSVLASGSITVAALWLTRLWLTERLRQSIQHEYATQLESFKATLKAEMDFKLAERQAELSGANAAQVERLRAELQIAAAERQLRRRHLHEREMEAIAETYENLSNVRTSSAAYVSIMESTSMGTRDERREALNSSIAKFRDRFRLHRLYLPEHLADEIHEFERELFWRANRFARQVDGMPRNKVNFEVWEKVDTFMEEEASKLFDKIETEFRGRLGQEEGALSTVVEDCY